MVQTSTKNSARNGAKIIPTFTYATILIIQGWVESGNELDLGSRLFDKGPEW